MITYHYTQALQIDGPLIDAASIAIISALRTTRIPKVRGIIGESGKEEDFEVSGDLGEALAVSCDRVPLFLTIGKVKHVFHRKLLVACHLFVCIQ